MNVKSIVSLACLLILFPISSSGGLKQEAGDDGWLVTIDDFEDALTLEWPADSKSASCYGGEKG